METMLSQFMSEIYSHSGATVRGVCKEAHMSQHTIQKCLRGETHVYLPIFALLKAS